MPFILLTLLNKIVKKVLAFIIGIWENSIQVKSKIL